MKKVLITGAAGKIGTIIANDLGKEYDFTLLDGAYPGQALNEFPVDVVKSYTALKFHLKGVDAAIHLVWNAQEENWKSSTVFPPNKTAAENVYKAAVEVGVKRVIMASSVHADGFNRWVWPGMHMDANTVPVPTSLYGASKVYIETLGRCYAADGMEVICIRFGGVDPNDTVRQEPGYKQIMLKRVDCANLIRCCLNVERLVSKFHVFYAVSQNPQRIHSVDNRVGWKP